MGNFINYSQGKEILEQVKSYVDSHGGGGGQQRPDFYPVLCSCSSQSGSMYFEPISPFYGCFKCDIWNYRTGKRISIEYHNNGRTYSTITHVDEEFEDDFYIIGDDNKGFYVKNCSDFLIVSVQYGTLNVRTGPSQWTVIQTTTTYPNVWSDGFAPMSIDCYSPDEDPYENKNCYVGKYRAYQTPLNDELVNIELNDVLNNYYIDILNTSNEESSVKMVLPSLYEKGFNIPIQRRVSFNNRGNGKKHIKIVGTENSSKENVFYEIDLDKNESISFECYWYKTGWVLGSKY